MDMDYELTRMDDFRVRVILSEMGNEVGVLYFERAKRGFINKPVGLGGWACVDASIPGLYVEGGDMSMTPKELIAKCQKLISGLA